MKQGAFAPAFADKNVEPMTQCIKQRGPILAAMASDGDIALAGAMYDIGTGEVQFS